MASYQLQVLNSSLSVTRTVADTTNHIASADTGNGTDAKVAVDASGNARFVAWNTATLTGGKTIRYCHIVNIESSDTTFAGPTPSSTVGEYLGTLVDCTPLGAPFYMAISGRFYQAVLNHNSASDSVDSAVLVDITSQYAAPEVERLSGALSKISPLAFRPAAVLDNYAANPPSLGATSIIYKPYVTDIPPRVTDLRKVYMNSACASSGKSNGNMVHQLVCQDPASVSFHSDVFSGGFCGTYDGYCPQEFGFYQKPTIDISNIGAGSIPAGSYNYVGIFLARDAAGRIHYSKVSDVVGITLAGASNVSVEIVIPTISARKDTTVTAEIYRTVTGGTYYRRVASQTMAVTQTRNSAGNRYAFTDSMTDTTLLTKTSLFRQPGTSGTALDRCPPLAAKHVVKNKDRTFYCNGNNVYYSSFDVDGEAPWFSPALVLYVPGGTGYLTGLGVIDGVLVAFKQDAVFVIHGDGPTENGGTGTEFTPPVRIHTEFGCVDPRSIVSTPAGLVYMSSRGIELLNRQFKVEWIGERVSETLKSYPYVGGAAFDRTTGRMYMALGSALTQSGRLDPDEAGVVVCYDFSQDVWSVFRFTGNKSDGSGDIGTYGDAKQDVCFAFTTDIDLSSFGITTETRDKGRIFSIDATTLYIERSTFKADYAPLAPAFIPWAMDTGWVKAGSRMDRIQVTDLYFQARRLSGHNVKCSFYKDYNRTTATVIKEFDASSTNVNAELLCFQPQEEFGSAMKFSVEGVSPTNPTTFGDGKQLEILGLSVRVGAKTGGAKLPAAQQG